MSEYIVRMPPDMPYEIRAELNAWYVNSEPIVRCRDCKHHEYLSVSYSDKLLSVCLSEQWIGAEGDNPLVESDGYCAWGERK